MVRNKEIGVVIDRWVMMGHLCFSYITVSRVKFYFS